MNIVEGLIRTISTAPHPERAADNAYAEVRRRHMPYTPEMARQVAENLLAGHAHGIQQLFGKLQESATPDLIQAQIEQALKRLTEAGREQPIFNAIGVADRAEFDERVKAGHDAAMARLEEDARREKIAEARVSWRLLQRGHMPDKLRTDLLAALEALGEHQARAFPEDVTTREDFDKKIEGAYETAKQAEALEKKAEQIRRAQNRFDKFGTHSFWSDLINPDEEAAAIHHSVNDILDGNYALLGYRDEKKSAEEILAELNTKHGKAMHLMADIVLEKAGIRKPFAFFSSNASISRARDLVDAGFQPHGFLEAISPDYRAGFLYFEEPIDPIAKQAILEDVALNEPVRFALLTMHFADRSERFDGMLAKTLACIEAMGGYDALSATVTRIGVEPKEWERIKTFLQKDPLEQAAETPADGFSAAADDVTAEKDLAPVAPEPIIAVAPPFNLAEDDAETIARFLQEDASGLAQLASSIKAVHNGAAVEDAKLEKIYRHHVQHLLALAEPVAAMAAFELHASEMVTVLQEQGSAFTPTFKAYSDIIADRKARVEGAPFLPAHLREGAKPEGLTF